MFEKFVRFIVLVIGVIPAGLKGLGFIDIIETIDIMPTTLELAQSQLSHPW